ncbi:hypothetical protein KCP70_06360 [Salmonella enterica subsp. enterica]|nr:hypothetical protein KCP70_06360 [Salmonella enterica subsp. enterica]
MERITARHGVCNRGPNNAAAARSPRPSARGEPIVTLPRDFYLCVNFTQALARCHFYCRTANVHYTQMRLRYVLAASG